MSLEVQDRASRGLHFFPEPIVNLGTHREPWYQDLSTKIYGEPERRSLSECRGVRGAASPPRQGVWGLEAPQEEQGV